MAKITLAAEQTFPAEVKIPVPGVGFVPLKVSYKWRSRTELKSFAETIKDETDDAKVFLSMVTGWELDDELNADNINRLIEKYQMAAIAVSRAYFDELILGRQGN